MRVKQEKLAGVLSIELDSFEDHRGIYVETYNEEAYTAAGLPHFIQDDYSMSGRHVLRGLHGDQETWKLVSCLLGELYFVVLDCRPESPDHGKWQSFILSERNNRQVLVPPGFANGHLVLSDRGIFHYKQTTYFSRNQFTVRWNDPKFDIWWPVKSPILSRRDDAGHYVE